MSAQPVVTLFSERNNDSTRQGKLVQQAIDAGATVDQQHSTPRRLEKQAVCTMPHCYLSDCLVFLPDTI